MLVRAKSIKDHVNPTAAVDAASSADEREHRRKTT